MRPHFIRRSEILDSKPYQTKRPFMGVRQNQQKKMVPKILDESIVNMSQEMKGYEINRANRIGSLNLANAPKKIVSSGAWANPKAQVSSGQR